MTSFNYPGKPFDDDREAGRPGGNSSPEASEEGSWSSFEQFHEDEDFLKIEKALTSLNFAEEDENFNYESLLHSLPISTVHVDRPSCRSSRSRMTSSSAASNSSSRTNFSFSNDRVRAIDRENQRLMQRIKACSSSTTTKRKPASRTQPSSAASVNRQRFLEQTQKENMKLLKRLEAVKPSKFLTTTQTLSSTTNSHGSAVVASSPQPRQRAAFRAAKRPGSTERSSTDRRFYVMDSEVVDGFRF